MSADDFIHTYGSQSYHAAMRMMVALHKVGGERQAVLRLGHVAFQLAFHHYYHLEPDLGPDGGSPALTVEKQLARVAHAS